MQSPYRIYNNIRDKVSVHRRVISYLTSHGQQTRGQPISHVHLIVIPSSLRCPGAHIGHQRIVKTERVLHVNFVC